MWLSMIGAFGCYVSTPILGHGQALETENTRAIAIAAMTHTGPSLATRLDLVEKKLDRILASVP